MKIGWLLYTKDYGGNDVLEFHKVEPMYYTGRLVQIVYAEIIE